MRDFKFFRGYTDKTITEQLEELLQEYPVTMPGITWDGITTIPNWTGTTYNPTWVVNPGLIQYTPPNYTIYSTPGTGTYTIPLSGTINTATGFSLTTSNPNGTTYTTANVGGTLTTSANTFYNQMIK
jgi:hypothetical protein